MALMQLPRETIQHENKAVKSRSCHCAVQFGVMEYWIIGAILLLIGLYYWLIILTEGVFLGRRLVVWLYDISAFRYDKVKDYELEDEQILVVEPILAGTRAVAPRLLDVATGTGRVPYFLMEDGRFEGEIVAIDGSAKMLGYAIKRIGELSAESQSHISFHHENATPLPFEDNSFDVVTSLEALEFLPDDAAALREMVRVLRPGGFLMVTRRKEWEAYAFLWRYRSRENMQNLVEQMGMGRVQLLDWQSNYDLVIGYKD